MNRFIKLFATSFLFIFLMVSAAAATEAKPEAASENTEPAVAEQKSTDPEAVLATVGGNEIKFKDILEVISRLDPQRAMMYDNEMGHRAILEEMVNMELFYLMGEEIEVEKDPKFIETLASVKKDIVRQFAVESIMKDVTVSDEDIQAFYEENQDKFKTPEMVRARHILVADEEEMKKVREDLDSGMSFEDAAKKHSVCPSKEQGGDLGFFAKGQMVPEFAEAAFAMEPGDVSEEPVETQFGLHMINVVERKEASVHPLDEVSAKISESLLSDKKANAYKEELDKLREKHEVVIIGEEKKD